uniref:Uncharacterized protein n=1 Tax=viral metagenome TaxID=1070528 RepID=A0A6C0JNN5_9ZZZZ
MSTSEITNEQVLEMLHHNPKDPNDPNYDVYDFIEKCDEEVKKKQHELEDEIKQMFYRTKEQEQGMYKKMYKEILKILRRQRQDLRKFKYDKNDVGRKQLIEDFGYRLDMHIEFESKRADESYFRRSFKKLFSGGIRRGKKSRKSRKTSKSRKMKK